MNDPFDRDAFEKEVNDVYKEKVLSDRKALLETILKTVCSDGGDKVQNAQDIITAIKAVKQWEGCPWEHNGGSKGKENDVILLMFEALLIAYGRKDINEDWSGA